MPRKKTNEEFLAELESKRGGEYTPLESYKGNQVKIKILHNACNNPIFIRPKDLLVKGVKCSHCSGNTKLSIDDMRRFIEFESDSNCKLISTEIENSQSRIEVLCNCQEKFTTTFSNFKHENKRQCNECGARNKKKAKSHSLEYVRSVVENKGYTLLSSEYLDNKTPLTIQCDKGHINPQTFNDFIGGHRCRDCQYEMNGSKFRKSYLEVKSLIEDAGYLLISDKYISSKDSLTIQCENEHTFPMTFDSFHYGNQRCPQCYLNRIRENATSHIFMWLRECMKDWKVESMKKHNYKCVITGKPMDVVHHLYSFNLIAKETMELLNMPILENLSDYTNEQINLMKAKCTELHQKYGLGVCLTKDIHSLFHSEYGRKVNTAEQFEEFKVRYKNGEFNDLVSA